MEMARMHHIGNGIHIPMYGAMVDLTECTKIDPILVECDVAGRTYQHTLTTVYQHDATGDVFVPCADLDALFT